MINTTEETVEIKAGELILNVPYTNEGLKVVRAMVTLLEAGIDTPEEEEGHEERTQPIPTSAFSTPIKSPMQRIKFKNWKPLAKTNMGTIYNEVLTRFLKEYEDKKGAEPATEALSHIIREMYGNHLKANSIAVYVSLYRKYIRENKLAAAYPVPKIKTGTKMRGKDLLPTEKVIEIWNLLPEKFEYKQVKALVPAYIMQSAPRIETTNYLIKQFLDNPAFWCEETSAGVFEKVKTEEGESF